VSIKTVDNYLLLPPILYGDFLAAGVDDGFKLKIGFGNLFFTIHFKSPSGKIALKAILLIFH